MPKALTDNQRIQILDLWTEGKGKAEIARLVGVQWATVGRIVNEQSQKKYRHVETYRCEGCRALVTLKPCPACVIRENKEKS